MRFLQLAALVSTALAADFVNPPASNVFSSPKNFPVYTEGSTIELIWTANSSYRPLSIVLRAASDGILVPTSGIDGVILSMFFFV